MQRFSSLFDGPVAKYHVPCHPWPPATALGASAPVTEIGIGYFPPDISEEDQRRWVQLNEVHVRDTMSKADGFLAYSGGMILEELQHPRLGPTKAYFGAWAWMTKEAHVQAAATEEWDRLTRPIQDFPHLLNVVMLHVDVDEMRKDET